jgi:hypothetical protein
MAAAYTQQRSGATNPPARQLLADSMGHGRYGWSFDDSVGLRALPVDA